MNLRNSLLRIGKFSDRNSRSGFSTSTWRPVQLNLTDLPRRLVSSPFDPVKTRLEIMFKMFGLDTSFRFGEFSKGTIQAVITVSKMISEGQLALLKPLMSENTLEIIKERLPLFNEEQKKLIAVRFKDIQGTAPYLYQRADDDASGRVFVKIGILYFVVPGFGDTLDKAFQRRNSVKEYEKVANIFRHNLIIADYRFVREYNKSVGSSWLVSECNHWKVSDFKDEFNL